MAKNSSRTITDPTHLIRSSDKMGVHEGWLHHRSGGDLERGQERDLRSGWLGLDPKNNLWMSSGAVEKRRQDFPQLDGFRCREGLWLPVLAQDLLQNSPRRKD